MSCMMMNWMGVLCGEAGAGRGEDHAVHQKRALRVAVLAPYGHGHVARVLVQQFPDVRDHDVPVVHRPSPLRFRL